MNANNKIELPLTSNVLDLHNISHVTHVFTVMFFYIEQRSLLSSEQLSVELIHADLPILPVYPVDYYLPVFNPIYQFTDR